VDARQPAALPADRGPHGVDDVRLVHARTLSSAWL
jgi:hypothetical protein